jgi:pimeloyl-ACP methyl ester carboxylesterase
MRILLSVLFSMISLQAWAEPVRCESLFREKIHVSDESLIKISKYSALDLSAGVPESHRTTVQLVTDENDRPVKTRTSVVLMHGLYNSPQAMAAIGAHFRSLGMNVINLRLEGHYESDTTPMDSSVHWQKWLEQGREALALARELGDEVILAGHSTGALTAAWLATETPHGIRGLAMFAPAIRVRATTRFAGNVLDLFGIKIPTPGGRRLTGHAAKEVTAMSNAYAAQLASTAPEKLAQIPVWLANTPSDITINYATAEGFVETLETAKPGRAPRLITRVPLWPIVLHDALPGVTNRSLPTLLQSMDTFFGLIP